MGYSGWDLRRGLWASAEPCLNSSFLQGVESRRVEGRKAEGTSPRSSLSRRPEDGVSVGQGSKVKVYGVIDGKSVWETGGTGTQTPTVFKPSGTSGNLRRSVRLSRTCYPE